MPRHPSTLRTASRRWCRWSNAEMRNWEELKSRNLVALNAKLKVGGERADRSEMPRAPSLRFRWLMPHQKTPRAMRCGKVSQGRHPWRHSVRLPASPENAARNALREIFKGAIPRRFSVRLLPHQKMRACDAIPAIAVTWIFTNGLRASATRTQPVRWSVRVEFARVPSCPWPHPNPGTSGKAVFMMIVR